MTDKQLLIAYAVCRNQLAKLYIEKKELEEEMKRRLNEELGKNIAK